MESSFILIAILCGLGGLVIASIVIWIVKRKEKK